jgi:dTDP-glucose 4,6-dehydratase
VNGETYNIGGHNEWKNIDLVHLLCRIMDQKLGRAEGESAKLITYVTDRAGTICATRSMQARSNVSSGWKPSITFEVGLERTVDWYLANTEWLDHVTSGPTAATTTGNTAVDRCGRPPVVDGR